MLSLKSISKSYKKKHVLDQVTHVFDTGVTVITGPSGSGKSTLLRLCATVEKPNSGQLEWQGEPLSKNRRKFRSVLGYAPQRIDFPEDISALDFLRHVGALKHLSYKVSTEQGRTLLEDLGLGQDADTLIQAYSGGMRRRLGLAQAFLGNPKCLILDEPTAELDSATAQTVHDMVFKLGSTAAILMTTHLTAGLDNYTYQTFQITS